MSDKTYNGWTNYETWRVNLEIFDGFDLEDYYQLDINKCDLYAIPDNLKNYAEEVIFECASIPSGLARDYAQAFLDAVNWNEIAKHLIADYAENEVTE